MNSQDFLRQSLNMCYLINQSKTWLFNANISQKQKLKTRIPFYTIMIPLSHLQAWIKFCTFSTAFFSCVHFENINIETTWKFNLFRIKIIYQNTLNVGKYWRYAHRIIGKSKIKVFLKQTDKTCYNFNNEICSRNPQTDSKTIFYMKVATPIGGKVHHLNLSNKDLFFMLQS